MKRIVLIVTAFCLLWTFNVQAQLTSCAGKAEEGQNLITNGDFESGDTDFSVPGYKSWNKGENAEAYSSPGEYFVTDDADNFNTGAFSGVPHDGTGMLTIDGLCTPGSIVWEQSIDVVQNTRYYFSVWIASIHPLAPAELSFEIDGQVLPEAIIAPNSTGSWVSFIDSSWYSGTIEGNVTFRIRNSQTVGCANGNDFALDDISISAGCFFGDNGEIPDLGANQRTICGTGTGTLDLTPDVPVGPVYEYLWSTGEQTSTITVDQPGFYAVCMTTNGSCVKSDIVQITDDFEVDLGPDIELCNPASAILDPNYNLGETYSWYKDEVLLGDVRDEQNIEVNEVGTYKVVVTDPVCSPEEDEIIITSGTFVAANAYYCPGVDAEDDVTLSVSNLGTATAADLVWYDSPALDNQVATGVTSVDLTDVTIDQTLYVVDGRTFNATTGPTATALQQTYYIDESSTIEHFERPFDALADFVINTVQVRSGPEWGGGCQANITSSKSITIALYQNGSATGQSVTQTINCGELTTINLGFNVPFGTGYSLIVPSVVQGSQAEFSFNNQNQSFNIPGIIEIPTNETSDGTALKSGIFFNWDISHGSPCAPVEVKAIYDPVRCTNCESPTDLTIDVTGTQPLICSADQATLTANVVGGIGTWNYIWSVNGIEDNSLSGASINVPKADAGNYTVKVEEQIEGDVCTASSQGVSVITEDPIAPSVSLNSDLALSQCLVGNVTAIATAQNFTPTPTYVWMVNGDNSQSQDLDNVSLSVNDGDVIMVSVTGSDECGDPVSATASSTVVGEEEITPTAVINGADGLCDSEDASLTATITPDNLTNVSYAWSINAGASTSTDPNYTVSLSDGDQIELTLNFNGGECLTSTTLVENSVADVTSSGAPDVTISVTNNDICADQLPMNFSIAGSSVGGATPSFEWFVDGKSEGTGTTFSSSVANAASVTAVMTSSAQCATQPTATSTPIVAIVKEMIDAEINLTGGNTICSGNDITITAEVIPNGTAGSYQWKRNGSDVGSDQNTYTSNGFLDGNVVSLEFTPSVECAVNAVVTPNSDVIISLEDPSVGMASIYEGDLCSGKDNGYRAVGATLAGANPTYAWTVNDDPTVLSTEDFIERNDFASGDTVKLLMTPDPSLNCPDAFALSILGSFQEQFEIYVNVNDSVLCDGTTLVLSASTLNGGDDPKYQWYNNDQIMVDDTLSSISVTGSQDDEYKVVFESSLYCIDDTLASDSITLHVVDQPFAEAGPDIALEDYIETILDGNGSSIGDFDYVWTTADTNLYESMIGRETIKATVTPTEKITTFYLTVTKSEEGVTCKDLDSTKVTVSFDFPIPNAFSPNGDGDNEVFEIDNLDKLDNFTIQIYNRWGSLLYEQSSPGDFWDGTNNGTPVPASTYFYIFTYELDGEKNATDGYISLIR